jgi:carbonic anhydrase
MTKGSGWSLFGFCGREEAASPPPPAAVAAVRVSAPQVEARSRPASPTPDEALSWLLDGNEAFISASVAPAPHAASEVASLAAGQTPLAVILGCSDSRAAAEILFQARMGDLFVVRVAGNTADALGLGSIDYAVHFLKCPLVMVLGHSKCGAVSAAVDMVINHTVIDPPVLDVLEPILPAVLEAQGQNPPDLVAASVRAHVVRVANKLKAAPSLKAVQDAGKLKIVAAHYDLANGKVGLLG